MFRPSPIIELHWRDWGGDSVALEASSGQIFRFDPLAAAVMACFEEAPRYFEDVMREVGSDLGAGPDPMLRETVHAIVEEFRRLGWLESIMSR
jgi:hypothetical protein